METSGHLWKSRSSPDGLWSRSSPDGLRSPSSPDSLSAGPRGRIGPPITASAHAATTYRSSQARPMTLAMGNTKHFIRHAATSADAVAPSTKSILSTTFATPSKPISSCLEPSAGRATHCVTWTSRLGGWAMAASAVCVVQRGAASAVQRRVVGRRCGGAACDAAS